MKRKRNGSDKTTVLVLFFLEVLLFASLFLLFPSATTAVVGQEVTVTTQLTVGAVFPEILNVTINDGNAVDLTANATTFVAVEIIIRDFDGEANIDNVTAEFFDNVASSYGSADDNNDHYTNGTCGIDTSYGSVYEVNATCIFDIEYYANNATWNATVVVTDNTSRTDQDDNTTTINQLLAVGLPDSINYGEVNSTQVSAEQIANVTNFGNVQINLTLEGYAHNQSDNQAMNCTLGSSQNISIHYEKYNLTTSNTSDLTFADFDSRYENLTNSSVTRAFELDYRQNDTGPYFDDTNSTYWRIFVPLGVAGTCEGNIIFGATIGAGS